MTVRGGAAGLPVSSQCPQRKAGHPPVRDLTQTERAGPWGSENNRAWIAGDRVSYLFHYLDRSLTQPLPFLAVGEPGLRLWSATADIRIFLLVDLLSDVGLGVLSVTLIQRLSKHVPGEPGESSVAAAARLAE